jgi:TATA-binding protein-associated factor
VQALRSLKKRIAPFIMRRTKNQVLKDLPPKIIQDYECTMAPSQARVHDYIDRVFPIEQVTSSN